MYSSPEAAKYWKERFGDIFESISEDGIDLRQIEAENQAKLTTPVSTVEVVKKPAAAAKKPAAKKTPKKAKKPAAKKTPKKANKPAAKKPAKKPAAKKSAAKKKATPKKGKK